MQAQNGSSLSDIQNEVAEGSDLIQTVGQLNQLIMKELSRARSTGRAQANVINDSIHVDKSNSPLRSALKSSQTGGLNKNLMDSLARNDRIEQLQRQLMEL